MKIGENTTVTLDYTLRDGQGNLLEETGEEGPVTYLHGRDMMLPGLENALAGKETGDSVTVSLSPSDAYGDRDDRLVIQVPETEFDEPESLEIGEDIHVHDGEGGAIMTVIAKDKGMVTLDGNHPYAGETVVFEVQIRDVRETSQEDLDELEKGCDCGCDHDHDHGEGHNCGGSGCCGH